MNNNRGLSKCLSCDCLKIQSAAAFIAAHLRVCVMAFSSLDESLCAKLSPTLGFFQCSWSEMVGNRLSKASRLKGRRCSQSLKIKVQRFISELQISLRHSRVPQGELQRKRSCRTISTLMTAMVAESLVHVNGFQ